MLFFCCDKNLPHHFVVTRVFFAQLFCIIIIGLFIFYLFDFTCINVNSEIHLHTQMLIAVVKEKRCFLNVYHANRLNLLQFQSDKLQHNLIYNIQNILLLPFSEKIKYFMKRLV